MRYDDMTDEMKKMVDDLVPCMPNAEDITNGIYKDLACEALIPAEDWQHWLRSCIRERIWFGLEAAKGYGYWEAIQKASAKEAV